ARKLEPLVVRKRAIHLNRPIEVSRGYRMGCDLHSKPLPEVIRATDVIAMQVGEPDLPNLALLENPIEHSLLFFIRRCRIDHDHLIAANHVTIRVRRRRQSWRANWNQHDS